MINKKHKKAVLLPFKITVSLANLRHKLRMVTTKKLFCFP